MKKGISLIVLVITIIVMIILAASVVISLNNTGIINKANQAVDLMSESQVQDLVALIWAEAYMEEYRGEKLVEEVENKLASQGITADKWNIVVTETGATVTLKGSGTVTNTTTLGSLVTAADYGKTINYEANGVTGWKVFYEDEAKGYIYLIASEELEYDKVPTTLKTATGASIASLNVMLGDNTKRTLGYMWWDIGSVPSSAATIQNSSRWMANWADYTKNANGRCASYFLDETYWSVFKNTSSNYASYVLGAIGTPTAEMFVASWNAKRLTETNTDKKKLALVANGTTGYYINDITASEQATSNTPYQSIVTTDSLYIWSTNYTTSVWLASPASNDAGYLLLVGSDGAVQFTDYAAQPYGIRPVVCLNSNIPAETGTTTDYVI